MAVLFLCFDSVVCVARCAILTFFSSARPPYRLKGLGGSPYVGENGKNANILGHSLPRPREGRVTQARDQLGWV